MSRANTVDNANMHGLNANNLDANLTMSKTTMTQQNMPNVVPSKMQPIQKSNVKHQLEYVNGRLKEESRVNYETYYSHKEETPDSYHPLVQYLDKTELKYYNDNVFYETPLGFPTKARLVIKLTFLSKVYLAFKMFF